MSSNLTWKADLRQRRRSWSKLGMHTTSPGECTRGPLHNKLHLGISAPNMEFRTMPSIVSPTWTKTLCEAILMFLASCWPGNRIADQDTIQCMITRSTLRMLQHLKHPKHLKAMCSRTLCGAMKVQGRTDGSARDARRLMASWRAEARPSRSNMFQIC